MPALHVIWSLPFVVLLLAIAILPALHRTHHWWERNSSKLLVSLLLGGIVLARYAFNGADQVARVLEHAILADYIPFMTLLFSLYVIAGGVQLRGDLRATPGVNAGLLGLGAVAASVVGTTGASMILIRPMLRANRRRANVRHTVVFFIFLVSNIGGALLPTGDPPLFLGYLQGVPFLWTVRLAPPWLFCSALLLAVYYVWDRRAFGREEPEVHVCDIRPERAELRGAINLIWLIGVVLCAALIVPGRPFPGTRLIVGTYAREAAMLGLVGLSYLTTPRNLRRESGFRYTAIGEVACLFLGIFVAMQPPMDILRERGGELGLTRPAEFFWVTGGLSSVLDNAPTYLVFFEVAKAVPAPEGIPAVALPSGSIPSHLLAAISLGAVFLGAMTYIGNGPNLMVKAIAEESGVAMPGFVGYLGYSLAILGPAFLLVQWLFVG